MTEDTDPTSGADEHRRSATQTAPDGGVPAAIAPPTDPSDEQPDEDEPEPIELLVQLAEKGEIEPWDIDIVEVTDKFLAHLDRGDLRTSARALFYASVLLRMKSDAMLEDDEAEDETDPEPWETDGAMFAAGTDLEVDGDPIAALEGELDRRLDRKHARGTPETLDELVRELRDAERDSWWKDSRSYDTSESPRGFHRGRQTLDYRANDDVRMDDEPTEADVTGNTHSEDIESVIADVRGALTDQFAAGRAEILYAEVAGAGGSRVETYLALLFLSHRGVIRLEQDELFGDLWIQPKDL